ncbi:MAG: hypothetical protein NC121_02665 [Blautia sp.]|nr:hypothetical protein [Blautia sp.]
MSSDGEIRDISGVERDLLNRLRARPGMYLAANSFQRLTNFLDGYRAALYAHGLSNDHCILPGRFHDFVQTKYGMHDARGYYIISMYEPDDEKALWLFFDLLDEYLATNGFEPIGETAAGLWYRLRTCLDRYDVFGKPGGAGMEELLKGRKAGKYREEYDRVKRAIDARKTPENFPDSVRSNLDYHRGLLQKIVFEHCANEELAQSVAEEVNMLCEGCQVAYHDEWYDRVLAVYKGSGIPYS